METMLRGISLGFVTLLAACAPLDAAQVKPEKEYRTGSNIAQPSNRGIRDSVQTREVDTADPSLGLPMGNRSPLPQGH